MTRLLDLFLSFYHIFVSPFLNQVLGVKAMCRYEETCSQYARRVIKQYGILYGLRLSLKRILSCQSLFHING